MKKQNKQLKTSKLGNLKNAKRKAVGLSSTKLVETSFFSSQQTIPLIVRPLIDGLNLTQWAENNQALIKNLLLEHRALLFRGFKIKTAPEFQEFVQVSSQGKLLEYIDRTSPRKTLKQNVYTSTIYPAKYPIILHNELSYGIKYPLRIYFCCTIRWQ